VVEIKVVSWFWVLIRLKIAWFLFYEWSWNLKECLKKIRRDGLHFGGFCLKSAYFMYVLHGSYLQVIKKFVVVHEINVVL